MFDDSPGPSSAVQLMPETRSRNLKLCVICQHVKDSQESSKLTSTHEGRNVVIRTCELLQDDLLKDLSEINLTKIQYHVKTCYAAYKRKGERHSQKQSQCKRTSDPSTESYLSSPENCLKRSKADSPMHPRDKPCIICNQIKYLGDTKRYRISDEIPAKMLLKAAAFNKDSVHTRIIFLKTVGDVYAADIIHHKNCLNKYIKQFQRDVEALMAMELEEQVDSPQLELVFKNLMDNLEIMKHGYALSDVRDLLNKQLEGHAATLTNSRLKNMLIAYFSDTICFTYPKDRRKSQMFFSASIKSEDIAETLRRADTINICAERLREECQNFDFGLTGSFNTAEDMDISYNKLTQNRPPQWEKFFNTLFPYRHNSVHIKRKSDTIFQMVYYIIHNGQKRTPSMSA